MRCWPLRAVVLLAFATFPFVASAQSVTDPVTPDRLRTYSTIYSIGIEWDILNDTNHDAAASVDYRVAGTSTWSAALPLVRVDDGVVNRLAGSVMFLHPATHYQVRVSLRDPDGGAAVRTVEVTTRRIPVAPTGRVLHVVPGSGGGSGSPGDPFGGIAAAQSVALPGDSFLLHAGPYGGRIRFDRGGSATRYVAWKAAGDGEVLLDGIDVAASHLWLEGLTVRNQRYALVSVDAPTNVVVTRCRLLVNHHGVFLSGGGTRWYIADNTIVGDTRTESGSFDGEGIDLQTTSGHTVAHNSITKVADGLSYPDVNVDIFGNDIFDTSDDGLEPDYGGANVRMWGNRIHNALHNGISFQPQRGAPWYIIRNQIAGSVEAAFKFRTTDRFVLLHNTIVHWGTAWPGTSMMCCNEGHLLRAIARNNLWISIQGGQIWGFDAAMRDWRTDLDYDGFDWGEAINAFAYQGITHADLFSLAAASGLETHGTRVFRDTCFEQLEVPAPSPASVPPQVMTLREGCEAVDAGAALPNINDGFAGAGPDLGAHEHGHAPAAYGPRPPVDVTPPPSED